MIPWVIECVAVSALLAAGVALLCRAVRFRPAVRHLLWLLVLLKLLMPPLVRWPRPQIAPSGRDEAVEAPALASEGEPPVFTVEDEVFGPVDVALSPPLVETPAPAPATAVDPVPPTDWLVPTLLRLWLVGAVAVGLVQAVRLVRFRRRVENGDDGPAWLAAEIAELADRLKVRPPRVRVVERLASPVVWGVGTPTLLWPRRLLAQLSAASRRAATVHELAHLRRRDHWVGWLQLAAGIVWWWNPVCWVARRQLGRAAELACDAWVIATLPASRRAYAEALLSVGELLSCRAAPAPAVGMGGAAKDLERRLVMVMRESVPAQLPLRAFGGFLLLGLIVFPIWSQDVAPTDPTRAATPIAPAAPLAPLDPVAAPAPLAPLPKPPQATDQERRLQNLEAALQDLLAEVKDLRGRKPASVPITGVPLLPRSSTPAPAGRTPSSRNEPALPSGPAAAPTTGVYGYELPRVREGQPVTLTLTRATYKLPKDKGEALVKLLQVQPTVPVMECKVEGDTLVVTTTTEAQAVVAEFVDLLNGKVRNRGLYTPTTPAMAYPPKLPSSSAK